MKNLRVIIIDDERIAREEVKRSLADFKEFEVIGEAKNFEEAKKEIESKKPDLIFLDIQMPGKSGFDLLESLVEVPYVVVTTAYHEYAVQAFDLEALDYLVKPLRKERFAKTIDRVRKRLIEDSQNGDAARGKQIFIKENNKCYFIQLRDIYLIESAGNYARIYFKERKTYIKRSLNKLEKALDPDIFFSNQQASDH